MPWAPILAGRFADETWAAIRDVALAVAEVAPDPQNATDLTLFWAHIAGALDEDWIAERYEEASSVLCATLPARRGLSLYGGLTGAAWVLAHVSSDGTTNEVLCEIDRAVLRALDVEPWRGSYDLISGLVGCGVYFIERLSNDDLPTAAQGVRRVVDHLIATSETVDDGVAWYSPPDQLPAWQRKLYSEGFFNCGLAHGTPGVIGLLGRIAAVGCDPRAVTLCEAALRWLRTQEVNDKGASRYPEVSTRTHGPHRAARTSWCYGDPGIAIASWSASARIGRPVEYWRALAREAAGRTPAECDLIDPGLCHGAAGLAHIYNRCYQASGDAVFCEAARAFFRHTLDLRRGDGIGGFAAWSTKGWQPRLGILDGATGVALALLAAVQPLEPVWDRRLLCDLPALDR